MMATLQAALHRRPFLVQSLTAGTLFAIGDTVAQRTATRAVVAHDKNDTASANSGTTTHGDRQQRQRHDWYRTARMVAYGSVIAAPATFAWYRALERHVKFKSAAAETVARVAADQLLFAPAFIAVFVAYQATAETLFANDGKSVVAEVSCRLSRDYTDILRANYLIWPWVQLANFYVVPLPYRLPVVNVVAIGWNGYLSRKVVDGGGNSGGGVVETAAVALER